MHHPQHDGAAAPGLAAPERASVDHPGLPSLGPAGAAAAGLIQKDETPAGDTARGFRDQGREDSPDCADPTAERKRFVTLHARMALAGWMLTGDNGGAFTAARCGMTRELQDLAAVEAFADQVGVPT